MVNGFRIRNHALVETKRPLELKKVNRFDLLKGVIISNCILGRYTAPPQSNSELNDNKGWWFCLKDSPIYIDQLTAKQRYRIRKGLKNNRCSIATLEEIKAVENDIYDCYVNSMLDYPKMYRNIGSKESLFAWIYKSLENDTGDIWLCRNIDSDKIIGFAHCRKRADMIDLSTLKIDPSYFHTEINASLGFEICKYYLNSGNFKYVCDGERNIRHITHYQDFLVRVLGFKKYHCELHIIYHPLIYPFIKILYPFRSFIAKMGKGNAKIYDFSCLLYQEQYARESKK